MVEFKLKQTSNPDNSFIELNKLLKVMHLVENGAMANQLISEGLVKLNGQIELRKRAKIRANDKVSFEEVTINVM